MNHTGADASTFEQVLNRDTLASDVPQSLPSGRSVVLRVGSAGEELEIRSPRGDLEVSIVLTDAGPVIRLGGARLELTAMDTVAVNCGRLEVNASEEVKVGSPGKLEMTGEEVRVRTQGDIHLNGDFIRLNCLEGGGGPLETFTKEASGDTDG